MPTRWTDPGEYRHPVTVQENRPTRDALGGQVDNWVDVSTRRAKLTPLAGREYVLSKQTQTQQTHRVNMRYDPAITTKHRLLLRDGRALYVQTVINLEERNRELELACSEDVA